MDDDRHDPTDRDATDRDATDASGRRWSGWLRPTPAELVGLAVLVLGSVVASLVWWSSSVTGPADLDGILGAGVPVDADGQADGAAAGVEPERSHPESAVTAPPPGGSPGPPPDPPAAVEGPGAAPVNPPVGSGGDTAGVTGGATDEVTDEVTVHLAGAVASPGLVTLAAGARVGDAVSAAGGLAGDADPDRINLARPLADGEHVHVPRLGEEQPPALAGGPPSGPDQGQAAGAGPVDLNRATAAELESLPGIGPSRAAAIVEYRERHGPFNVPGDLRAVSGIGEATFQNLAELVTVGG